MKYLNEIDFSLDIRKRHSTVFRTIFLAALGEMPAVLMD
jgi:hypothetical protein